MVTTKTNQYNKCGMSWIVMLTWQNDTRAGVLFLQTLRSYTIGKMQPDICQFFPLMYVFNMNLMSSKQKPKKKTTDTHATVSPPRLMHFPKKISFFFVFFSSADTRRFPLRVSGITSKLSELFHSVRAVSTNYFKISSAICDASSSL